MKSGVNPVKLDHRDYSFGRTFGAVSPETFGDSLNTDLGLTMPNQDADGFPYGCTSYTQTDISTDEQHVIFLPRFTYDQTMMMMGILPGDPDYEKVGCDLRDSLNSTIVYGMQPQGQPAGVSLNYRNGAYFNVDLVQGLDWFDSIRSCIDQNRRSVSMATPWFSTFETPQNGVIRAPNSYDVSNASFHNWKCCGWKTINGVAYLVGKSWQGSTYGDMGYCYFPREVINSLMSLSGSAAFTVIPYSNQNAQTVILTLWQTIISYLNLIKRKLS